MDNTMKKILLLLMVSFQLIYTMEENHWTKRAREESQNTKNDILPTAVANQENTNSIRKKQVFEELGVSIDVALRLMLKAAREGNLDFITRALKAGMSPNDCTALGSSPLCYAAAYNHKKIVKLLLKEGAHINGAFKNCTMRPLMATARLGQWRMMKFLMKFGATMDQRCVNYIAELGHPELRQLFAEQNCGTMLCLPITDNNSLALATQIITEKINEKEQLRILSKKEDMAKLLFLQKMIEAGNFYSVMVLVGESVFLHKKANEYLLKSATNNDMQAFTLIRAGIDTNICDEYERTPLIHACINNNSDLAEMLIYHNANINARDLYGWTALIWAAALGYKNIVELLLYHKADVSCHDIKGKRAIDYSEDFKQQEITEILLANKAAYYRTDPMNTELECQFC